MFVTKSQNIYQYCCSVDFRYAGYGYSHIEYRKSSILGNGVQFGFAAEYTCKFKVVKE
jgi:hypothetical protein